MKSLSEMVVNNIFANQGVLSPSSETVAAVRKIVNCIVESTPHPKSFWETDYWKNFLLGEDDSFWTQKSGESFQEVFTKVDSIRSYQVYPPAKWKRKNHENIHLVRSENRYLFFREGNRLYFCDNVVLIPAGITPIGIKLGVDSEGRYVTWEGRPLVGNLKKPADTVLDLFPYPDGILVFPTTEGFRAAHQDEDEVTDSFLDNLTGLNPNSLEYFSCRPALTPHTNGYEYAPSYWGDPFKWLEERDHRPVLVLARTKSGDSYYAVVAPRNNPYFEGRCEWQKVSGGNTFVVEGQFKGQPVRITEKVNGDLEISYGGRVISLGNGHLSEAKIISNNDFFQTIRIVIYDYQGEIQTQVLEINLSSDGNISKRLLPCPGSNVKVDKLNRVGNPKKRDKEVASPLAKEKAKTIADRLTNWPYTRGQLLHPIFGAASLADKDIPTVAKIWDRWSQFQDETIEKKANLFMGLLPMNGNDLARTTMLVEEGRTKYKSYRITGGSTLGEKLTIDALGCWDVPIAMVQEKYLNQLQDDFSTGVKGISGVQFIWVTRSDLENDRYYSGDYAKSWVVDNNQNLWMLRYLDTPELKAKNIKFLNVLAQTLLMEDVNHCRYFLNLETGDFSALPPNRKWLAGGIYCENGVYVTPKGDPYLLSGKTIAVPKALKFCPSFSDELHIVPDASGKMLLLKDDLSASYLDLTIDIDAATYFTPVARVVTSNKRPDRSTAPVPKEMHWVYVRDRSGKIRFYNYSSSKLVAGKVFKDESSTASLVAVKPYKNFTVEYSRTKGVSAKFDTKKRPLVLVPRHCQLIKMVVTSKILEVTYQKNDGKAYDTSLTHKQGSYSYQCQEKPHNIFMDEDYNWEINPSSDPRINELTMDDIFPYPNRYEISYKGFHRLILASLNAEDRENFLDFLKELRATESPEGRSWDRSNWAEAQALTADNQPSLWDRYYDSWAHFYDCLYLANFDLEAALEAIRKTLQRQANTEDVYGRKDLFIDTAKTTFWGMPDVPERWI